MHATARSTKSGDTEGRRPMSPVKLAVVPHQRMTDQDFHILLDALTEVTMAESGPSGEGVVAMQFDRRT